MSMSDAGRHYNESAACECYVCGFEQFAEDPCNCEIKCPRCGSRMVIK